MIFSNFTKSLQYTIILLKSLFLYGKPAQRKAASLFNQHTGYMMIRIIDNYETITKIIIIIIDNNL